MEEAEGDIIDALVLHTDSISAALAEGKKKRRETFAEIQRDQDELSDRLRRASLLKLEVTDMMKRNRIEIEDMGGVVNGAEDEDTETKGPVVSEDLVKAAADLLSNAKDSAKEYVALKSVDEVHKMMKQAQRKVFELEEAVELFHSQALDAIEEYVSVVEMGVRRGVGVDERSSPW